MYFNTGTVGATIREKTPTFCRDQEKNGFGIGRSVHSVGELIWSSVCGQYIGYGFSHLLVRVAVLAVGLWTSIESVEAFLRWLMRRAHSRNCCGSEVSVPTGTAGQIGPKKYPVVSVLEK